MDYKVYKSGKMRGNKIKYNDGIGCTIWIPFKEEGEDESVGCCFDFPDDYSDDLLNLVTEMKMSEPDTYIEDPKYEEHKKKIEIKEAKLWYKIYQKVQDIGITIAPFDWKFRVFLISRPIASKGYGYLFKLCKGFVFGPITVTW